MDPLINKFKYVSSFQKKNVTNELIINHYVNNNDVILVPDIKYNLLNTYQDEPYLFFDKELYLARENTTINNHPIKYFVNQNMTILANIDAVYNLLDVYYANFLKRNNNYNFVYLVAQDDEGDFVRYIQYRKTNAYGAGITRENNWNYQYINTVLFAPYDGYDLTGEITTNYNTFTRDAVETIEEKYGLVLCNDNNNGENNILNNRKQEISFVNKFIIECIVGLTCTSTYGTFVLHAYDLHCHINAQIVYLLSLCFNSVSIIKPFTTDVASGSRYIVCQNKIDSDVGVSLLKNAINNIIDGEYVSNLFDNELPNDFIDYLTDQNNDVLYYQLQSYNNYNFDNAMMYLNLPDNYVPKPINVVV